ncbi:MAG TPA: metalloregulator ArsR/SmtB family transcription factor [Gaiellaceae bacterium]
MNALEALADPTRRRILELLTGSERSAGEIATHFDTSRPGVSRHLRVLREAGLVHVREDGPRRLYSLNAEPLADLQLWLENRLDALDTEIRRRRRKR